MRIWTGPAEFKTYGPEHTKADEPERKETEPPATDELRRRTKALLLDFEREGALRQ
jgi:hypothetical protein